MIKRFFIKLFHKHKYDFNSDFIIDRETGLKKIIECNICHKPRNPDIVHQIEWDNYFFEKNKYEDEVRKIENKLAKIYSEFLWGPIFDRIIKSKKESKKQNNLDFC